MGQLDGKVAIVTGAGQNIGRAIALRFAAEGAAVAVVDRDQGRAEAVGDEIEAAGGRAIAVLADVSDEDDVSRGVDQVVRELGDVHLLVNNAAATINKTPAGDVARRVGVRDRRHAPLAVPVHPEGRPAMIVGRARRRDREHGRRRAGTAGTSGKGAYPVAKGGVLNLTRVAAVELAPHGIRVNSVTPTQSGQPLGYGYQADVFERSGPARSIPLGRWGRPEDQASAALFLASDEASFITGADLPCDGGLLAVFPKSL